MAFIPKLNTKISIQNSTFTFTEHPSAKNMPYGQMGKRATVYQLRDERGKLLALKVFRKNYQTADMVGICQRLSPFSRRPGLEVCHVINGDISTQNAGIKSSLNNTEKVPSWV